MLIGLVVGPFLLGVWFFGRGIAMFRVVRLGGHHVRNARGNVADVHDAAVFSCIVPSQELPSDEEGDDCVLLGGMSSSRSPGPLPRSPTTQLHGDRLWQGLGGGNELHYTPQAAGARYFAMDATEDVGEAPAAGRPAPLLEVLPQERVQRRTVEQIVDHNAGGPIASCV